MLGGAVPKSHPPSACSRELNLSPLSPGSPCLLCPPSLGVPTLPLLSHSPKFLSFSVAAQLIFMVA